MRVLITGISGFAGQHLARHLAESSPGAKIYGTVLALQQQAPELPAVLHALDLREAAAVKQLIEQLQPDQIYHLAALSSPAQSYNAPWETIENNVRAQTNLIQACLSHRYQPRILIVSSGDVYAAQDTALDEDQPFYPNSPYAASKIAQDIIGLQYSRQLPIIVARPFNHTGPGQMSGFVAPDFATKIAEIEAGQRSPTIHVRNLRARVDFTDVRDVVRAYRLLMEQGTPGTAYNIASGEAHSTGELLDILLGMSTLTARPEIITSGPQTATLKLGNASRLHALTGWKPLIPFRQTLLNLLQDCRRRVEQQPAASS